MRQIAEEIDSLEQVVIVEVVEKAFDVVLGAGAYGRCLNVSEDPRQRLVEVLIVPSALANVREEVTGQDVKALLLHRLLTTELGIGVAQVAVVEVGVASLPLGCVEVCSQVLGDEPVEQHPKDVSLEVPSVDTAAKVVGDSPDGLVKL